MEWQAEQGWLMVQPVARMARGEFCPQLAQLGARVFAAGGGVELHFGNEARLGWQATMSRRFCAFFVQLTTRCAAPGRCPRTSKAPLFLQTCGGVRTGHGLAAFFVVEREGQHAPRSRPPTARAAAPAPCWRARESTTMSLLLLALGNGGEQGDVARHVQQAFDLGAGPWCRGVDHLPPARWAIQSQKLQHVAPARGSGLFSGSSLS